MKNFLLILLLSFFSVVHAEEDIFFVQKPAYVSNDQARAAVKSAALKKRWTVYPVDNNKLIIGLNHRGYKALLKFSFSSETIFYSDQTLFYFDDFEDDEFGEARGEWKKTSVPERWVRNLKIEVNDYFNRVSEKEVLSSKGLEKKLESLKHLYKKKLITEEEYNLKKKEIMSRY